jgi:hypothetical protein
MASEKTKGETEVAVFLRFLEVSQLPINRESVEKRSPPSQTYCVSTNRKGRSRLNSLKCAIRGSQNQLQR